MSGPRRVLLLGGGYVTLHAYAALVRRLRRELRRGDVEVVVLSADDAHSFHGFTGEAVAGLLPYELTRTPLAPAMPRARVVHGRALRVDPRRREVVYEPAAGGRAVLAYDELVVGTGSREPVRDVPGLATYGCTLRVPGDIPELVDRVRRLAAGSAGAGLGTVVVAGGGLGGVELAAALADRGRLPGGGSVLRVVLVHSGERV
ncbi:MAG TPA: FAD-dependent oxidoreductase, partial [Jiangellales bacterium]|nr:FAD-dependent oxidoreductase [Jiangellales bacterium]